MEIKNVKVSKLENKELLDVKKQVESFLKFLNSEYDTVKKLEEENSWNLKNKMYKNKKKKLI